MMFCIIVEMVACLPYRQKKAAILALLSKLIDIKFCFFIGIIQMNSNFRKLGIIAGGGDIPRMLISQCIQQNRDFVVLAIEGNAEKKII